MQKRLLVLTAIPAAVLVFAFPVLAQEGEDQPQTETPTPANYTDLLAGINGTLNRLLEHETRNEIDFLLIYDLDTVTLSCPARFPSIQHDGISKHRGYMVWDDATIKSGTLTVNGEHSGHPFHVLEMDLNGGTFTGKGVFHGHGSVCLGTDEIFEFDIWGTCTGTGFTMTTKNPLGFNVTTTDFDVFCHDMS